VRTEIFPADTQWAIAARVSPAVLTAAQRRLPKLLRSRGSRVVSGDGGVGGVSALLVFGGSLDAGYDLAITISQEHGTPAYLLDFNDEAYSIRQFEGTQVRWHKGHPAKLLRSHGITPPGYEPLPESTVRAIGLVEHVTLAQACEALPEAKASFMAGSRGVLVEDVSGTVTLALSRAFQRRSFTLFYDHKGMRFWCLIWNSDASPEECFAIRRSTAGYEPIDRVLGEGTVDGILHALEIPRELLFWDGEPAPRVRTALQVRRKP
jgi:hypothetical protein